MGFKLNKSNISINIQPVAKPRMTRSDRWKKRPVVLKYWQFKDALKEKAEQKNWNLSKEITIYFSIAMPKSWSKKKKKQMNLQPHQQKPDIDNLIKSVLDSLAEDDSYIYSVKAVKSWSEKGNVWIINNQLLITFFNNYGI